MKRSEHETIFEKGVPNPFGEYFTGQSYLAMLTQLNGVGVANVTFEPACRNNWHIHHGENGGGQILLVTGGRGWYQEWGKEAQEGRRCGYNSCGCETLAWGGKRQLVFPCCHRGSRRGYFQ